MKRWVTDRSRQKIDSFWAFFRFALMGVLAIRALPAQASRSDVERGQGFYLGEAKEAPAAPAQKLWTQRMRGAISGLSVSRRGEAILVATLPESEIPGSASRPEVVQLDQKGRVRWRHAFKAAIRDQDLAEEGSLAVVADYSATLTAFDARGKVLWTRAGMCRPRILGRTQRILCYHDDDAEPQVAFDVYDAKGTKLLSYPIQRDILALDSSPQGHAVVLGLTGGEIHGLDTDFKPVWKQAQKVEGEVVDLAVADPKGPSEVAVAVLHRSKDGAQKISILNGSGAVVASVAPSFRATQVKIAPSGDGIYYYGNNEKGQFVGAALAPSWKEAWKRGGSLGSEFSSSIAVGPKQVVFGVEEHSRSGRRSRILGFDPKGDLFLDTVISAQEGSYLFTHKIAPDVSFLTVGTDDGRLTAYHWRSPAKN